jgi:transposase
VINAMSEGLNDQIQKIKSMACGFRNIENFKTAIYLRCGGLDMYLC